MGDRRSSGLVVTQLARPEVHHLSASPSEHVVCHRLSHAFTSDRGDIVALQDVTIDIREHEFVCVVGPSGCGKTTLLRLLAGIESPRSGGIEFRGMRAQHGARGGLVVQENGCFPWMTALENVAFGLRLQGVPVNERRARARVFLARVGLESFGDHYPHELSVGMRQRLGIGRAFVTDAPLLLMDEPFGALDAQTRRHMQDELLTIWAADRRTVVFVTHDIEEAVRLADRVLVMSDRPGRIIADVPVDMPRPRGRQTDARAIDALVARVWDMLGPPCRTPGTGRAD